MRCDTYAAGNCTRGACEFAPWIPEGLGDGGDWAADYQARGGLVTLTPTPCSVVCYCRGNGYSQFGHVAFVEEVFADGTFRVRERNFIAFDQDDERVSNGGDVCGFLLPPGAAPGGIGVCGQGAPSAAQPGVPGEVVKAIDLVRYYTNEYHFYQYGRILGVVADIDRWAL